MYLLEVFHNAAITSYLHCMLFEENKYRKISNMRCTKSQNLNDSCLILQLFLPNPFKPGVKSRMKM